MIDMKKYIKELRRKLEKTCKLMSNSPAIIYGVLMFMLISLMSARDYGDNKDSD